LQKNDEKLAKNNVCVLSLTLLTKIKLKSNQTKSNQINEWTIISHFCLLACPALPAYLH